MAVRSFTDGAGMPWTVWAVRPASRERRAGADRRAGGDRRAARGSRTGRPPLPGTGAERRSAEDRRLATDRRLTARLRGGTLPGLEQGWLCFEGAGERRRLSPIPPDWEGCPTTALAAYSRRATRTRPSLRDA